MWAAAPRQDHASFSTPQVPLRALTCAAARRKLLVEMATGTGKTRTAAALLKRLFEANWTTRALFVVDRNTLSASNGRDKEFTGALTRMRNANRFPSNDFANIFGRAYTFANNYPNIRHSGDADCVKRNLRKEDAILSALGFVGLSGCIHNLCADES
jgi:Type III restriction enzyme, res subunit